MNEQIDVVWQHARWAMEEANNRYALDVYVRVSSDAYNVTLCLASPYGRHQTVFARDVSARYYNEAMVRAKLDYVLRQHAIQRSIKT